MDEDKKNSLEHYRPRKKPRQKRSQILFDRILTTARELFEAEGYASVSTNQIAEAANISIGSVYQYFANCESIALAIYEEASARATLVMKRQAYEILNLPIEESMLLLFTTAYDIFDKDRFVLLQLIDEVPELREAAHAVSFDNLMHRTTQTYLELHFPDVPKSLIIPKAYLVEKSVTGTVKRHLEEQPDNLSKETLIKELVAMVSLYLASLNASK